MSVRSKVQVPHATIAGLTQPQDVALATESSATGLTAAAGGGQAAALPLVSDVNRITTVTTAGDSVRLPVSVDGARVTVINGGANPMQVYGAGTDTINAVATATGVSQMPNSAVLYVCSVAGLWHSVGLATGFSGSYETVSTKDSLVAFAGGGQASGTALPAMINRVITVATAADSVKLPVSAPGMSLVVVNAAAANAMNVFPASGESINALGNDTAFSVAANKACTFYCTAAGKWHSVLTA